MTTERQIELAMNKPPETPFERHLLAVAKEADPDAWRFPWHTKRMRSLEAAERHLALESAARSALLPEPEPRVSGWWDRLAERMFAGKREMAR